MEYQIKYWSPYFKQLNEAREEIIELTDVETKKYQRTLEREIEYVSKTLTSIKKSNKKIVPNSVLVEFYESHGIHPLQVKEKANEIGLEIEVPSDFFSSIVKMHAPKVQKEEINELEKIIKEKIPATEKLFYQSTKLFDFEAKVIFVKDKNIILDKTAFYAESGGQLSDQGKIIWKGGEANVTNVVKVGVVIVHTVDNVPSVGTIIKGHINKDRRLALSIHHTSTHIINGAARRVLGEHVWQAGAQKDVNESRLDITHYSNISDEEVKKIEKIANDVVRENLPVKVYELPRLEAEKKYGYRLYQGGAVPGKELRVIKIANHDVEACGGTHMRRTGDIGFIKIIKVEHIQDGVERIIFASGDAALERVQATTDIVKDVSNKLLVPPEKVPETLQKVLVEKDELYKKIKKYSKRISEMSISYIKEKAEPISNIKVYFTIDPDLDESTQIEIGSKAIKQIPELLYCALIPANNVIQIIVFSGELVQRKNIYANEIVKNISSIIGGSGGGDKRFGRGGGNDVDKVEKTQEALKTYLKSMI